MYAVQFRIRPSEPDILKRRWLLIDIDPQRPAGVSSSDEEKALALEKMKEVHAFLKSKGCAHTIRLLQGRRCGGTDAL